MARAIAWIGSRAAGLGVVFLISWAIWSPADALEVVAMTVFFMAAIAGFQWLHQRAEG
jgi:hypothetical protein